MLKSQRSSKLALASGFLIVLVSAILPLAWAAPAIAASYEEQQAIYDLMFTKKDYQAGLPRLQKAAEEGDVYCQRLLAQAYQTGIPDVLRKNNKKAVSWYRKGADSGDTESLVTIGDAYYFGLLGLKRDWAKSLEYFDKAIVKDISRAKAVRASLLFKGIVVKQDLEASFKLMMEAALQKEQNAAFNVAERYRLGAGCKKDINEAVVWYSKAAPALIADAEKYPEEGQLLYAVGFLYQNGWGTTQDQTLAAQYFTKALPKLKREARWKRDTNSMIYLSEMADNGYGRTKDAKAARKWLKRAAARGDGEAQWRIAHAAETQP